MIERMRAAREEALRIDSLPRWVATAMIMLMRPRREERRQGLRRGRASATRIDGSCSGDTHTKITSIWNSQLLRINARAAAET